MAAKQLSGDDLSANLAGMSKNQLYDIMSQMKALIEQNQQQARQILIQNPQLTKALFQAQIMLGMVQPPQAIPNIPPATSQHPQQSTQPPQQSAQPPQQSNVQAALTIPGQQNQLSTSLAPNPLIKKEQPNQPVMSSPSLNVQTQPIVHHQPKGHLNAQAAAMSLPQSSQIHNLPPPPQQLSHFQPPMPTSASTQSQQQLQTGGGPPPHMQLQPPLPPQPRPPSMSTFGHQFHSQMGPNAGFQHSGQPQMHHSQQQPMFHGGPTFSQGHPTLATQHQQQPQSIYQGGPSHSGMEFNQDRNSMQAERGSSWMPGLRENIQGAQQHLPGPPPPPFMGGQVGPGGSQPPRPAPLTPDMESALLQQVMSLTPEQINLLPPEQRNQVVQLQRMLRQ